MTPPDVAPMSLTEPLLIRRADLLAQGYSDNQIRRDLRQGAMAPLAPGVYLAGSLAHDLSTAERYRAVLGALVSRLAGDPVISHLSAAILLGLPVAESGLLPLHVIRSGSAKSRPGTSVYAHRATLLPRDRVIVGGLSATSPARTVLDCALLLPPDAALPIAVAALHRGQVTAKALADQLNRRARVPGVRRVAALLDRALLDRALLDLAPLDLAPLDLAPLDVPISSAR